MKWSHNQAELVAIETESSPDGEWKKLRAISRPLRGLKLSEFKVYVRDPDNSDLVNVWIVQGLIRRETLTIDEFEAAR